MRARPTLAAIFLFIAPVVYPQEPQYEFSGKPIRVHAACTPEQVSSLGLTCSSTDPCPIFLELSDVEEVGPRLIVSGNLHTESTTIESILLSSDDGGHHWTEPAQRIPMAGLDRIQFFDFATGWIAGEIQQIVPREPFLLSTTDGGKSWRRQPIGPADQVGAVEKFRFSSLQKGIVLVDRVQPDDNGMRHLLFESMTGGSSWSLSEISPKPIPWTYGDPAERDVAVRPDTATKSYQVQRRVNGRSDSIANFAIHAGECKPVEQETATKPSGTPN